MKFEDRWSNDEWAAKAKIYLDDKTAVKTEEVLFAIRSKDALPPGKYDIKAMESVLRAMGWQQFIRIDRQENQEILWFETDPRA